MVIGLPGIIQFILIDELLLLLPAVIYSTQAPFRTATGSPHGFVRDRNPDRVGVGGRKDAGGDPRTAFDGNLESQVLQAAVGMQPALCDGFPIDEDFNRYVTGIAKPGAFNVPVGFLLVGEVPYSGIWFLRQKGCSPDVGLW